MQRSGRDGVPIRLSARGDLSLLARLRAHPLERRLLFSYLGAFAIVIVIFAVGVRFSFAAILQQQATARLAILARAGTAAIDFTARGYTVDARTLGGFDVHSSTEGLQWFDAHGRFKASRGLVQHRMVDPVEGRRGIRSGGMLLESYTVPIRDPAGKTRGYVRASETVAALEAGRSALDLGLAIGSVLAILAAALGGAALASAAVAQREESYERLREFTADASHELRTPLAALATTAAVAVREAPGLPETTQRRLTTIAALADQMGRLVDDLLILARAGRSLEREMFVVPVAAMLQRVTDAHAALAAEKSIALHLHPCPAMQIYGSPGQLERIVANLVENAIRYTSSGGSVDVSCTSDTANVRIAIRDTGAGIPAAYRGRVFDRFWRGDNARGDGGSGLGLAIARALARRHEGDIVVASEPGRGSVFTLTLPRRPPSVT